ncbi:MAG TPA: hypothetical protein VNO30_02175 [Kofleriaceae bacterium]|nr:hypothetical protein [Kofleriaceae bacterium]
MPRAASTAIAIAVAIAALAPGGVRAAPAPPQPAAHPQERVVLADPDPELLRAVLSALAPWRLEVIVDDVPPADKAAAKERATRMDARFVVWRRGGALVVYDREHDATEERATTKGRLDAVGAAAAALSVKTLMRLPPPPPEGGDGTGTGTDDGTGTGTGTGGGIAVAPAARPGPSLRAQAALATRLATGSSTELGGRLALAVLVRPLPRLGWRIGLAGDLGSSTSIQRAGFKGTWSDWAVLALTGWTLRLGAWELEPQLGGGVTRSTLEGIEMSGGRHERVTLGFLRAGAAGRRRFGRWTVGAAVGADWILGTPTYTRTGSSAEIFKVPPFTLALGVLGAADFGGSVW